MDRNISLALVELEIVRAVEMGKSLWNIEVDVNDPLRFTVTMNNKNIEGPFIFEFYCDNYKEFPPIIDLIDHKTKEKGVRSAYPNGDSLFHDNLVICHYCNRKAYKDYSGLHSEWIQENWVVDAKGASTLGDIIIMLYRHLQNCTGRKS